MNKLRNVKCKVDGIKFDSKHEAERYLILKDKQRRGEITGLALQQRFELIPSQRRNGKVVERPCYYVADFCYVENGKAVAEDAKGFKTEVYKIKKKLMLERYNIQIKET